VRFTMYHSEPRSGAVPRGVTTQLRVIPMSPICIRYGSTGSVVAYGLTDILTPRMGALRRPALRVLVTRRGHTLNRG